MENCCWVAHPGQRDPAPPVGTTLPALHPAVPATQWLTLPLRSQCPHTTDALLGGVQEDSRAPATGQGLWLLWPSVAQCRGTVYPCEAAELHYHKRNKVPKPIEQPSYYSHNLYYGIKGVHCSILQVYHKVWTLKWCAPLPGEQYFVPHNNLWLHTVLSHSLVCTAVYLLKVQQWYPQDTQDKCSTQYTPLHALFCWAFWYIQW